LFLIDAHCHINSDPLRGDAPNIIRRAREAGVARILIAGTDLATSAEAVELARAYASDGVRAAVGVHPHDAKTIVDRTVIDGTAAGSLSASGLPESLLKLASDPNVAAVGETGLDYHYNHSPREAQKKIFRLHIEWASRIGKPLIIHVREGQAQQDRNAMKDALRILEDAFSANANTHPLLMFHCYAGGLEYLNAMRDLDAYLSIGGPVTWPSGGELREVVRRAPEDRLLCETDSPWLTPKPYRGKLNEPAYVRLIYEEIAKAREMPAEDLARSVEANAARLFDWRPLYGEFFNV
jgi:TatD DNase family protein